MKNVLIEYYSDTHCVVYNHSELNTKDSNGLHWAKYTHKNKVLKK